MAGLVWSVLVVGMLAGSSGCGLSEEECLKIRGEAFDILNDHARENPHTCADDAACNASEWPGCAMPVNTKNLEKIGPLKAKFDEGNCTEPPAECPEVPVMYCKQGLCVKLHSAGEKGNTAGDKGNTDAETDNPAGDSPAVEN
jgi:hypothetical protein